MQHRPPAFLKELQAIYDRNQAEQDERRKTVLDLRHNPSSASMELDGKVIGACNRALYWRHFKEPKSNVSGLANILQRDFGNAIHDLILGLFKTSKNFTLADEQGGKVLLDPLTNELSYRIDGVVLTPESKGGMELKTTQGGSLTYQKKEGTTPKQDHCLQVADYFHADQSLEWFSLIYLARDSGYHLEYHLWYDNNKLYCQRVLPWADVVCLDWLDYDKVLARRTALELAVKTKTLPPRDFQAVLRPDGSITDKRQSEGVEYKSDMLCAKYCDWRSKCWSMPDAKQFAKLS